jgi:hypothetical protein
MIRCRSQHFVVFSCFRPASKVWTISSHKILTLSCFCIFAPQKHKIWQSQYFCSILNLFPQHSIMFSLFCLASRRAKIRHSKVSCHINHIRWIQDLYVSWA